MILEGTARKGTHVVRPFPEEARKLRLRDGDTAEQTEDDQQERVRRRRNEDGGRESANHLTEGHRVELGDEDHEQCVARSVACAVEARGVPHEDPVDDGAEDAVRRLCCQLRCCKDPSAVHPRGRLAGEGDSAHNVHGLDCGGGGENGEISITELNISRQRGQTHTLSDDNGWQNGL